MEFNDLRIDEIKIRQHDQCPNGVIIIEWSGSNGFGRYELVREEDGKLHAFTECMDNDQKLFTKALLKLLADMIVVEE